MAEIEFVNVSKSYGKTVAVKDLSFRVADNEFFCFFGPPSSGKTTILRLILGLETPDEGEIRIGGKEVTLLPPAARNVAMVFQNLALFPHMTARDNIRFPLVERRVAPAVAETRLAAVSEKLHIGHILHKLPAHLSGGERQRVAIARALVVEPNAYLMDDPISALDARLREETRVELKRIQAELGRTLVYVTHDQEEAMSVADRMAVLEHGEIRQLGSPRDVYMTPASRYVAKLVGSPPINLIPGRVDQAQSLFRADGGELKVPLANRSQAGAGALELGVRPEDVRIVSPERPDAAPAEVYELQPLGGYTIVDVNYGGLILRALVQGQTALKLGERIGIALDPARVHLFSGEDGRALAHGSSATAAA
jgi:multiple sugar transport system ATP-binding protein